MVCVPSVTPQVEMCSHNYTNIMAYETRTSLGDLGGGVKGAMATPLALRNMCSEWPFFMHKQYIIEKGFSLALFGILFLFLS